MGALIERMVSARDTMDSVARVWLNNEAMGQEEPVRPGHRRPGSSACRTYDLSLLGAGG